VRTEKHYWFGAYLSMPLLGGTHTHTHTLIHTPSLDSPLIASSHHESQKSPDFSSRSIFGTGSEMTCESTQSVLAHRNRSNSYTDVTVPH